VEGWSGDPSLQLADVSLIGRFSRRWR